MYNRFLGITEPEQWRYIRTSENPADILSRRAAPNELQYKDLWWKGPHWSESHSEAWKQSTFISQKQELPEQRNIKLVLVTVNPLVNMYQHFFNWRRLLSGVVWILRFINYLKSKKKLDVPKYLTKRSILERDIGIGRKKGCRKDQQVKGAVTIFGRRLDFSRWSSSTRTNS